MTRTEFTYDQVNMLSELTRAYLRGDDSVKHLYKYASTPENVLKVIEQRAALQPVDRELLVDVLNTQYADIQTSSNVDSNISSLLHNNTYTITTGHQLNLFTGPLYFIYKIISVIQTAKYLNEKYPDLHFVPVYWMATEDHDFEEINHTYVKGEKVIWNSNQTGMVGDFNLKGLDGVLGSLKNILGDSIQTQALLNTLESAYLKQENLAQATRYLVNDLFENEGLVILDGNASRLKSSFSKVMKDELLHHTSFPLVMGTISSFPKGMKAQVNPREINLFYVSSGSRERIVYDGTNYQVNNTDLVFSETEILEELESFPERFSPNVILRPVYQELVLPNVMYIGGGAEVAYWLELKSTFDHHQVSYPLIQIRDSFLILNEKLSKRLNGSPLQLLDLFKDHKSQLEIVLNGQNPFEDTLKDYQIELDQKFQTLIRDLESYDVHLTRSLKSTKVGVMKELRKLERKVNRSVKRNNTNEIQSLNSIREGIYPCGYFQERHINVMDMWNEWGPGFLEIIKENSKPFTKEMVVLLQGKG